MANSLGSISRFLIPLVLLYAAFTFLGTIGGTIVVILILLFIIYKNRAFIYQNRGSKKYHKGDFDGALADIKTAVGLNPGAAKIRGSYAFLLLKLGHTEEAGVQIDEAIKRTETEPDKNALRVTKALVLWKQGKLDEAIEDLTELLKVYENTNVYATLGFLYIAKGDYDKALEFNLESKEYNSSNAIILDNLGLTYFLLGDYEKALETYKEIMKCKPNFPEAYYNYARVLDKMEDLDTALYMARHALTLRFWNTSTITKQEVEAFLEELEAKEKTFATTAKKEYQQPEVDVENNETTINEAENEVE